MKSPQRRHDADRWRGPFWLRLMALMCALLLGAGSTAQACHSHDDGSALTKNSPVNVPTDHCPLCLAMHTALPAAGQSAPSLVRGVEELAKETSEVRRTGVWSVSLFGRPPPAIRSALLPAVRSMPAVQLLPAA